MQELLRRKDALLDNHNLHNQIKRLITIKNLNATLCSTTLITGRDGREEIVIELLIDGEIQNKPFISKVYLYITEDIFNEKAFEHIDEQINLKQKPDIDFLILLRALRVVFNVISDVGTGGLYKIDYTKPIYVRTAYNGTCDFKN